MQTFLDQPEATFYHIALLENWNNIQRLGIFGKNGKIFVSRVGEFPILAAIALEQLPGIYTATGIAILKLPQVLNHFQASEIYKDNQTKDEVTKVFQNIIKRNWIPPGQFELMMEYRFNEFSLTFFNQMAYQGNLHAPDHAIYHRALAMQIQELPSELPEGFE